MSSLFSAFQGKRKSKTKEKKDERISSIDFESCKPNGIQKSPNSASSTKSNETSPPFSITNFNTLNTKIRVKVPEPSQNIQFVTSAAVPNFQYKRRHVVVDKKDSPTEQSGFMFDQSASTNGNLQFGKLKPELNKTKLDNTQVSTEHFLENIQQNESFEEVMSYVHEELNAITSEIQKAVERANEKISSAQERFSERMQRQLQDEIRLSYQQQLNDISTMVSKSAQAKNYAALLRKQVNLT